MSKKQSQHYTQRYQQQQQHARNSITALAAASVSLNERAKKRVSTKTCRAYDNRHTSAQTQTKSTSFVSQRRFSKRKALPFDNQPASLLRLLFGGHEQAKTKWAGLVMVDNFGVHEWATAIASNSSGDGRQLWCCNTSSTQRIGGCVCMLTDGAWLSWLCFWSVFWLIFKFVVTDDATATMALALSPTLALALTGVGVAVDDNDVAAGKRCARWCWRSC